MKIIIKDGTIVNNGLSYKGSLLIEYNRVSQIIMDNDPKINEKIEAIYRDKHIDKTISALGMYILPGVIDDQVHFREPGNTDKATIESESIAAVLGGVTSFMDMPNNTPSTTTNEALEGKYKIAEDHSYANYSFYLGATNYNIDEIRRVDKTKVCGIKVFMGSSTGNMLVNDEQALNAIFKESPILIATHCEQEEIIQANLKEYTAKYGENIPFEAHSNIRSREACITCTKRALKLAIENNSRLHILHISTAEEIELIRQARKKNPKITGEVCVHYMWFNQNDYAKYGSRIKCNPAIKLTSDMLAIRDAVKDGIIKVVATDHAPHLKCEKDNNYSNAPGGLPLVQHSLQLMLELSRKGIFTIEEVVARMSHGPAECFNIQNRGFIKEGDFADLVIVNLNLPDSTTTNNPAYKCGWSPFEGETFGSSIVHTFVNGVQVVENGKLTGQRSAEALTFNR
ncbi:MAG: dihydroorotase [Bacteroidales bacterium]